MQQKPSPKIRLSSLIVVLVFLGFAGLSWITRLSLFEIVFWFIFALIVGFLRDDPNLYSDAKNLTSGKGDNGTRDKTLNSE